MSVGRFDLGISVELRQNRAGAGLNLADPEQDDAVAASVGVGQMTHRPAFDAGAWAAECVGNTDREARSERRRPALVTWSP